MKNMNVKYFMVLTVFILGLGDVPLQATNAKMNSSSTAQKMSQSSGKVSTLSAQQRKDLTDTLNAIRKTEKELKKLQAELPNPKDPKEKQTSNVNPKDLASALTCVQDLKPHLIKLANELPAAQKTHLMMTINPQDVKKALDQMPDLEKNMKHLQKSLNPSEVKIQVTEAIGFTELIITIISCLGYLVFVASEIEAALEAGL